MVTAKSHEDGSNLTRFVRVRRLRLRTVCPLVVLMAGVLLCDVAAAQPRPGGIGPLERLGQPAAEQPAPEPVEAAEPDEAPPQPKQNYEELPVDESLRRNVTKVNPILMEGRFAPGGQALFDEFYQKYFLARWTQVKNIGSLPAYRKDLRNSHLGKKSASAAVHDHLNALVLEFMKKLATGPYHPAVQVNAMLMIGELDSVQQPPTPLPEALDAMMAAAEDAKLSDAVRAAAMVGIQRHAAATISDQEARKKLTAAMLKLAASDLPAGAAAAGREWILAQAIETLGLLGSVGEKNAVFGMMIKTVSDAKLSYAVRGIAAESLGRLNYSGVAGINPVEAAAVLGQFVIDACTEELRLAKKDSNYPVSRRRMKQCLSAVLTALMGGEEATRKGIASLAREPGQQAFIGELQKIIEGFVELLDDRRRDGDDLKGPVDQLRSKVEARLKKKG